jgi:hypothetical protein
MHFRPDFSAAHYIVWNDYSVNVEAYKTSWSSVANGGVFAGLSYH